MDNGLKKVNQENLTAKVYDQLKNALMSGRFRPGERMAIRPLAEQLGTSPTPVREALLKLISYGALEMKPSHPIVVPMMTKGKYLENRSLRIAVEGLAAETAANIICKSEIEHLKKLHLETKNPAAAKKALENDLIKGGAPLLDYFHSLPHE